MINKILVPVDGSDHAKKAIQFAANTAAQNDAEVHLLHVVNVPEIPEGIKEYMKIEGITEETPTSLYTQMVGKGIIDAAKDEASQNGVKNVETVQLEGDPAEMIIEYAKENGFDMIVIGSRGLGKVKGFLLGSVSSKVCHAADKTCVTVK